MSTLHRAHMPQTPTSPNERGQIFSVPLTAREEHPVQGEKLTLLAPFHEDAQCSLHRLARPSLVGAFQGRRASRPPQTLEPLPSVSTVQWL